MRGSGPATPADEALFPGFHPERIRTRETEIHTIVGGQGPPVLLLHGYPLWAESRRSERDWDSVAIWRDWAHDVRGQPVPSGHFLPEEAPAEALAALEPFLAQ